MFALILSLFFFVSCSALLNAQATGSTISGTVADANGGVIKNALVTASDDATGARHTAQTDGAGHYAITGLPAGTYKVQISATGFATQTRDIVVVNAGAAVTVPASLQIASVSQEVTVEAEGDTSIAAQLSPVKSLLDAASARTEITSQYVTEFTSPVTDFGDITNIAPGTYALSENGVGMGQAKIYFRGFVDDDYTVTWDGIPFGDTNDPSHHSWAFVPAPAIGYVDFDRSPGTASDMGLANYGGSIHYFSPQPSDSMSMHFTESTGSWNTNMVLGQFDSGLFLHGKANFWFEGHHMGSDGYQTENFQQRTAGTAKFTYKFSNKTYLSLVGTSVIADSNTPNNDPYRFQLAANGDNFLLQSNQYNADGTLNGLYYKYYTYHVPTDFEVITFTKDFAHGLRLELKPYTYNYSNHQHYNNDQYSETNSTVGLNTNPIVPCNGAQTKACMTAIDKMNQYNRGGAIATVSAASKYGVFRTGGWMEYAYTNRYQDGTDPTTWIDATELQFLSFRESFITRTFQPFAEYQLVAVPRLTLTGGFKSADYNQTLTQWASGKKIGLLGCPGTATAQSCPTVALHEAKYNNILPSIEANVRLQPYWSVYGQYGRASIIPFSSIFDVTNAEVAQTPPPTVATTYQGGTVLKVNHLSMDADAYHIHFINQYSSYTYPASSGPNAGLTYYYASPPGDTNGIEGEGNLYFAKGISLFMNGTLGKAVYEAAAAQAPSPANGNLGVPASTEAWKALAPHDTESLGMTYQSKGYDMGFFNKRVGSRWEDDACASLGTCHQVVPLNPFWMNNLFLNYTVRNGSRWDNSKLKLSINNVFNFHNITDISANNALTGTEGNGVLYTPSPLDTTPLLAGRSIMITFQFGFQPKER